MGQLLGLGCERKEKRKTQKHKQTGQNINYKPAILAYKHIGITKRQPESEAAHLTFKLMHRFASSYRFELELTPTRSLLNRCFSLKHRGDLAVGVATVNDLKTHFQTQF